MLVVTAFYILIGIPTYGFMLTKLATSFAELYMKKETQHRQKNKVVNAGNELIEFCNMEKLHDSPEISEEDFILIHLIRNGKIGVEFIKKLRSDFRNIDKRRRGMVPMSKICKGWDSKILPNLKRVSEHKLTVVEKREFAKTFVESCEEADNPMRWTRTERLLHAPRPPSPIIFGSPAMNPIRHLQFDTDP